MPQVNGGPGKKTKSSELQVQHFFTILRCFLNTSGKTEFGGFYKFCSLLERGCMILTNIENFPTQKHQLRLDIP